MKTTLYGTFPIVRQVFVSKQQKVDTVIKKQQQLSVEVDGLLSHVADVRLVPSFATEEENIDGLSVTEDARCTKEPTYQDSESPSVNKIRQC